MNTPQHEADLILSQWQMEGLRRIGQQLRGEVDEAEVQAEQARRDALGREFDEALSEFVTVLNERRDRHPELAGDPDRDPAAWRQYVRQGGEW